MPQSRAAAVFCLFCGDGSFADSGVLANGRTHHRAGYTGSLLGLMNVYVGTENVLAFSQVDWSIEGALVAFLETGLGLQGDDAIFYSAVQLHKQIYQTR